MKIMAALCVPAMLLGVSALTVTPAEAHTPKISADCDGVSVAATSYDASKDNRWSVTIDGVTQSGTFGASFSQTFPVPQDGATTTWSASVEAEDGSYKGQDTGTVGPCGTPPPVDVCVDLPGDQPVGTECTPPPNVERVEAKSLNGCDVSFEGTEYGAGDLTYDEQFTDTYVFNSGTNTWDLVTDTTPTVANVEFTPWTVQEQVDAGCVDTPGQPPAEESSQSTTAINCDTEVQVTTTETTTTEYVYDDQTNTWVLGDPVTETTTSESPVKAGDCDDDTEVLGAQQQAANPIPQVAAVTAPAAAPAPAAVPTAVDAGVSPATSTVAAIVPAAGPAGPGTGVLALLTLGGLLVGAGALRTRRA